MSDLESPDEGAGGRFQRDDRVCPLVIAGPRPSVVIRDRASSGNEHEISLQVSGERGPGIGRAGAHALLVGPRDWIPCPLLYARSRVVCADDAAWHVDGAVVS